MKLGECMLAWTPGSDRVEVGKWPDTTRWSDGYDFSANPRTQAELLCEVIALVMVDGVAPAAAHRELLKIDEYRAALPADA
jgi:hypothetical protein